jgi:hypothetical protein
MPNLYRSQQRIRELRGKVRGGITVVLDSPAEAAGLQKLIRSAAGLPGDPLANAYQAIVGAGVRLSDWPEWRQSGEFGSRDARYPGSRASSPMISKANRGSLCFCMASCQPTPAHSTNLSLRSSSNRRSPTSTLSAGHTTRLLTSRSTPRILPR